MNIIKVDSSIKNIASSLSECGSAVTNISSSMSNNVDSVNSAWSGTDATKYTTKLNNDYTVLFSDFIKCLETFSEFLNSAYEKYKKIDTDFAGRKII